MILNMMRLVLLSILSLTISSPVPREPDHYIDRREFLGRGRSLVKLPVPLVTRTQDEEDSDVELSNEILTEDLDREEFVEKQDISDIVMKKVLDSNLITTPRSEEEPESRLRPLEYYYQFISVNVVDGTSRGGDGFNLITQSCCHEVRVQG